MADPTRYPPKECPECGKLIRYDGWARHRRLVHGVEAGPRGGKGVPRRRRPVEQTAADEPTVDLPDLDGESPFTAETPPGANPSANGAGHRKLFGAFRSKSTAKSSPTAKRSRPRVDASELLEQGWTGLAAVVIRRDMPVGRVMMFQAPFVGGVLDEAVKGTPVDRPVQALARNYGRMSTLSAVIGVPVVVAAIERRPDLHPVLVPALRSMMQTMLVELARGAKKARRRQDEQTAALRDIADMLDPDLAAILTADGRNPVDALIELIFEPPPGEPPPAPEEPTWTAEPQPSTT